jgi:hypothetical protein
MKKIYETAAEKQRAYRERKAETSETMAQRKEVVLLPRKCPLCERTWSSSVEMICPYCRGKGKVLTQP